MPGFSETSLLGRMGSGSAWGTVSGVAVVAPGASAKGPGHVLPGVYQLGSGAGWRINRRGPTRRPVAGRPCPTPRRWLRRGRAGGQSGTGESQHARAEERPPGAHHCQVRWDRTLNWNVRVGNQPDASEPTLSRGVTRWTAQARRAVSPAARSRRGMHSPPIAGKQAAVCRHGAELADRTRRRWAHSV